MNIQIMAIALAVSLSFGFISGWKVNSWHEASNREVEAKTLTEAMEAAAKELAKIEVKNVTIRQQMETKIIERVAYRDCKHDDDGLRLLNEALTGKSIDSSKLPGANTTK